MGLLPLLALAPAMAQESSELPFEATSGPTTGALGRIATIDVPAGYSFVERSQMKAFNEFTGNLHNSQDLGALIAQEQGWIALFSYDPVGYVKDDQRDELEPGELLEQMRRNDGAANAERRKRGFPELNTVGWFQEPFYDSRTNHLTWGLELDADGEHIINHQIRVLGRGGVMNVIVVDDPHAIAGSVAEFEPLLGTHQFTSGNRYAEFRSGDKVAEYGLAALVLGGGAALAAKTGLLAKLGKFLKPLLIALVVGGAAFGRQIKSWFGRGPVSYGQRPGA